MQTVRSTVDLSKPVFACKIFDLRGFGGSDLKLILSEVKINRMLQSDYCIKHHQTIKTASKIYMFLEYANSFDLETLIF